MSGPNLTIKKRILIILIIFTIISLALIVRVAWIQIADGAELQRLAFLQHNPGRDINPRRGTIYDANGVELAVSISVETISINPREMQDKYDEQRISEISGQLSDILDLTDKEKETALAKMKKASRYEKVKEKVDKEVGNKVRQWIQKNNIYGVNVDEDSKRVYPKGNLAAHVIGFTRVDNVGADGIESIMERYLKGTKGKVLSEVDAGGRDLPYKTEKRIEPQQGLNVYLTIDETIQYFAEKALEDAIEEYKVLNGATAIVIDPRNGDILALASKPDFDLNDPWGAPSGVDPAAWSGTTAADVKVLQETVWRNKAIVDTYEPGSTFKAITSAAGLEEGVIRPDSPVTDKTVVVGGWSIDCWKPNAHLNETFTEGVYNSCNPVFVRLSQSLGIDRFYKYVKAFGFYEKTKISLYGEANSIFHPKPTETNMATASFGQRFQITPIQLISAYAAIANGGDLMKPRLIKEVTDSEGNIVMKYEPEVVRNVISKQTSDTLKEILEGVVAVGTGHNAYVKGYRIAGKTGTSETLQSKTEGRYIASFSAFAPADNPVVNVLVILDHPNVYPHTGGMIAAPVAGKLVEDILNYLGVERRYTEQDKELMLVTTTVPSVKGLTLEEAKSRLKEKKLIYKVEGDGNNKNAVIMEQTPKAEAEVKENSTIILYTYKPEQEVTVAVPDLINRTLDEAVQALSNYGLNIRINGMGKVIKQSQKAGTLVPKGDIIEVELRDFNTE